MQATIESLGRTVGPSEPPVGPRRAAELDPTVEERVADSAALAQAIADSDIDALEHSLQQFHASACFFHRQVLRTMVERERRGQLSERDGVRDGAEWLALKFGISPAQARRWAAVAWKLEDLPHIALAFEHGEIAWESVTYLTEFATPDDETELLAWAKNLSADRIRTAARRARAAKEKGDAAYEECYVRLRRAHDNAPWRISGLLTAEQGATINKALEVMTEEPQRRDHDDRTFPQRYADALTDMARAQLGSNASKDPDRATLVMHVHARDARAGRGIGDLEDGTSLPNEITRRIACDCRLQVVLNDDDGRSIGLGRTARTPNASLYRYLRDRDRGCRFPSCGRTRFLKSHHIDHWVDDGPTDPENLVLLCGFHHKLVHEGGWGIRGNPDNGILRFVRPNGRKLMAGPLRLEPANLERLFRNSGPLTPVW